MGLAGGEGEGEGGGGGGGGFVRWVDFLAFTSGWGMGGWGVESAMGMAVGMAVEMGGEREGKGR